MPSIINASNSTGLTLTSDLSGTLQFQNNGVNLPMSGVAPAFSARSNATQTIASGTFVKIDLAVENFDTNNNFASSRFTPSVAGYYQCNWGVRCEGVTTLESALFKNGSLLSTGSVIATTTYVSTGSELVFLNGTTDYIELFCAQYSGSSQGITGNQNTRLSGCLVRGA